MSRESAQKSAGVGVGAGDGDSGSPRHWVWVGGPVPPGADAVTIGPVVCVRRGAAHDDELLRHELVHVGQWRRLGLVGFLRQYVGAYLRWRLHGYGHWAAYRRIPLEVEATWEARIVTSARSD
jgi:hypothetical protein